MSAQNITKGEIMLIKGYKDGTTFIVKINNWDLLALFAAEVDRFEYIKEA